MDENMKTIKQKFIVDESGSMAPQQMTVISGFNEQLNSMKQEEKANGVRYLVTLVKFNENVTTLYTDKPLAEVKELTTETYVPSGWTALLDAIGKTIDTATPGESDVLITIFTDGAENRSKEWKKNTIKTLIDLRQRENKWGFVYFGANVDAFSEASSLGISNAVDYTMANTGAAIYAMNAVRSCYVSTATSGEYNVSNLTSTVNTNDLVK
jgi:uncharacterized protein YegL